MSYEKEKVKITFERLKEYAWRHVENVTEMEYVKSEAYKNGNTPPMGGWEVFPVDTRIGGADMHYWFRSKFKTPEADKDCYFVLQCTTGREGLWNGSNPQCLMYLNGEMVQGFDTNHTDTYLEPDTEYTMHNYVYIGSIEELIDHKIAIKSVNSRIEKLYHDMRVPFECCEMLEENSDDYINIMSALIGTANCIDFRNPYSKEYYDSIEKAISFIETELYEKLCSTDGKPVVNCIGHSHIDVEWLWTRFQTREKIQRTASTVTTLMKKYPEFKFMLTQPEIYQYLKEEASEKYEEVKELVKEGRWEPEGAMYVESDCNLVSGESFVRQILYGKRFFKDEFDVESNILFHPDVFGYSGALPQILKKSGIDYFATSKISLNDTNTFPNDTFIWKGIDGTEIFTHLVTSQEYTHEPTRRTVYGGMLEPKWIKGNWNRYQQKEYCKSTMMTFGWGDGGGGPTGEMLENAKRLEKGIPGMPVVKIKFMREILEDIKKQFEEGCRKNHYVPKWEGEMYLEFHRGTYTSVARNKKNNRKSELMMQNIEALSCIDEMFGGEYDKAGIDKNWKLVLHNQFHDIIPGSSIKEVYELSDIDYANIKDYCEGEIKKKIEMLAGNVKADSGILVYNPLGFERRGNICINGKTVETNEKIPAFGWKVLSNFDAQSEVKISGLTAENKFYIMTLDNAGRVIRLFDKSAEREVIVSGKVGNEMQVFEDMPRVYDNWEINDYYVHKQWIVDEPCEIKPITDGTRGGFEVKRKYMNSEIVQHIWLYTKSRRIDFENSIDWHENEQLLKFAFPLDVHFNSATYEIQYGNVTRPAHQNTSWDKAKFEVFGHKWVDVSENGYGVALLNDCKYGHNIDGDTLKITAIKCGRWPNDKDDREKHTFTYSLLPHMGDLYSSGVINEAYCLNQPLISADVSGGCGTLENEFSFVSCDKPNVIIETVKKAEDENGVIVRMYDAFDSRTKAEITVADGFKKAYLCDLMENNIKELEFDGNIVKIPVSNFEIVTLRFTK